MLKLYNTLSRKKETFKPIKKGKVGIYTCGPTVYLFAHIGNLRTYIFEDILKRVLRYNGYKIKQVMNITDVGHLTSDADTGEDKMEKGAKREKKTVWQIADFYTKAFKKDLKSLNILSPDIWVKATDTIKDQIKLIKILEKKGFTYKTLDGIYFNTSKLKSYGRLTGSKKKKLRPGARIKIVKGKKSHTDFALWKFTPPGVKRQMEWDSPWGRGFPGWHTECVVMSIKELGIPFDIHCGGIDHITIHHPNEIAQAEAAYGKIFAKYWLHGEFLILKKGKMAKSKGNIVILDDLIKKGINPLTYRYLALNAHYRSKLTFSWQALKGAEQSLNNLYQKVREIKVNSKQKIVGNKKKGYKKKFLQFVNNDLNTPKALALTWKLVKDDKLSNKEKYNLLLDFDKVFGLNLGKVKKIKIPQKIRSLVKKREQLRKESQWKEADEIRKEIEKLGYQIEDTKKGSKIKKL
jgi:cysteinyl-tRNA synthetase